MPLIHIELRKHHLGVVRVHRVAHARSLARHRLQGRGGGFRFTAVDGNERTREAAVDRKLRVTERLRLAIRLITSRMGLIELASQSFGVGIGRERPYTASRIPARRLSSAGPAASLYTDFVLDDL
jgi:hypothetical protein